MHRLATIAAITLLAVACSDGSGDPTVNDAPAASEPAAEEIDTIPVELGEWSVLPDEDNVVSDDLTFEVSNVGQMPHEFVVAENSGPLPTNDDGSVNEEEIEVLGEVEDLEPGDDGDLEIELEPGSYWLFCNLIEEHGEETEVHYKLGMRTEFTVS